MTSLSYDTPISEASREPNSWTFNEVANYLGTWETPSYPVPSPIQPSPGHKWAYMASLCRRHNQVEMATRRHFHAAGVAREEMISWPVSTERTMWWDLKCFLGLVGGNPVMTGEKFHSSEGKLMGIMFEFVPGQYADWYDQGWEYPLADGQEAVYVQVSFSDAIDEHGAQSVPGEIWVTTKPGRGPITRTSTESFIRAFSPTYKYPQIEYPNIS